jgi:methyl-accepting chemotaxis protein
MSSGSYRAPKWLPQGLTWQILLPLSLVTLVGILLFSILFIQFEKYRVKGPVYGDIKDGQDLIADILPPPAYIIEAYLTAHLIADMSDTAQLSQAFLKLKSLEKDYNARMDWWKVELKDTTARQIYFEQAIPPALEFFKTVQGPFQEAIRAGDLAKSKAILNQTLKFKYEEHRKAIDLLSAQTYQYNQSLENSVQDHLNRLQWILIPAGFASIVASFILGLWMSRRSLIQPLDQLRLSMNITAEGDLTQILPDMGSGEVGQLAKTFDQMTQELRNVILELRSATDTLSSASSDMASSAEEVECTAQSTRLQTAATKTNMDHLQGAFSQISRSISSVSDRICAVAAAVEELTASATEIAHSCRLQAQRVQALNETMDAVQLRMRQLTEQAKAVGNVVDLIREIAGQTQLLALNATIEAARAGSSGKGFAVVASEVKQLSRQTGDATDKIRQQIESIQSQVTEVDVWVGKAGAENREVAQIAATIDEVSQAQTQTLHSLSTDTVGISEQAGLIADEVQTAVVHMDETHQRIGEVDEASQQVAQGMTPWRQKAEELNQLAEMIDSRVRHFKA